LLRIAVVIERYAEIVAIIELKTCPWIPVYKTSVQSLISKGIGLVVLRSACIRACIEIDFPFVVIQRNVAAVGKLVVDVMVAICAVQQIVIAAVVFVEGTNVGSSSYYIHSIINR
jgi:hypothetical protein